MEEEKDKRQTDGLQANVSCREDEKLQADGRRTDELQTGGQRLDLTLFAEKIRRLKEQIAMVLVGQEQTVDLVLTAILADGHVLIEGVPGENLAGATGGAVGRGGFQPGAVYA